MALRKYPLFIAAMAHIKTFKSHWNQEYYNCQTGMCCAGWVGVLGGGRFRGKDGDEMSKIPADIRKKEGWNKDQPVDVSIVSTAMLGLGETSAYSPTGAYLGELYDGGNDYQALLKLGAALFNKTIAQVKEDVAAYIKDNNLKDPFNKRIVTSAKTA